MRVLIIGFGNVGQRFAEVLSVERLKFTGLTGLHFTVVGIVTRTRGALANPAGVDLMRALTEIRRDGRFSVDNPDSVRMDAEEAVRLLEYDVLLELSVLSVNQRGEPALSYVREGLQRSRHVVTANKGPIAFAYSELHTLAERVRRRLLFEAAVMDGAPVFNLSREALRGCRITGVSGILNSTTNDVLSRVEHGVSIREAVEVAQREGFAEAQLSNDLEGWDAAAKIAVLANVLMGGSLTPLEVERRGVTDLDPDWVRSVREDGKHVKLICRAWRESGTVRAAVQPEEVPRGHLFSAVGGTGTVLRIETDLMAPILIIQERPTLLDTVYGVLNDLMTVENEVNESAARQ